VKKYLFKTMAILGLFAFINTFNPFLWSDLLHTTDRKVYEGKLVAFKFNTIFFNVYKFGKIVSSERFPLDKVWKIEFNEPEKRLESSYDLEQNYEKLRRGKRSKKIVLQGTTKWIDTGIDVRLGQDILFDVTGSIYIDERTSVFQNGELELNWNKGKPLPNQPTGAIIGKIGEKGTMFYIGADRAPFQVIEKGRLIIGVNDFDFKDNSGKFTVTIFF